MKTPISALIAMKILHLCGFPAAGSTRKNATNCYA